MAVVSRRSFVAGATAAVLSQGGLRRMLAADTQSPFRIAVITDEISQDFDHACSIAAKQFGMQWVEIRGMWNKNAINLDDKEIAEAKGILAKYQLQVTDIASPLFKTDWPGAPRSKFSPKNDSFGASFGFQQQDEVLEKSIALAKQLGTTRVRGFDFWRLDDQAPYRDGINQKLREAAETCAKRNIVFVLENEFECNTATGREAAKTLAAVTNPNFMLNWDPANAVAAGEVDAFPAGWNLLPKDRIGHCHCKNAVRTDGGKGFSWEPVGTGLIDWTAQFKALKDIGYHYAVSLETHWRGGGTPEASTIASWAGMKEALEKAGALS